MFPRTQPYPAGQAKPIAYVGTAASGSRGFNVNCLSWVLLSDADKLAYAAGINRANPSGPAKAINNYCATKILAGINPAGQADSSGGDSSQVNYSGTADMNFLPDGSMVDGSGAFYDPQGNVVGGTSATTTEANIPESTLGGSAPTPGSSASLNLPASVQIPGASTPTTTNPVVTANSPATTTAATTAATTNTTTAASSTLTGLSPREQTALFTAAGGALGIAGATIAAVVASNNQSDVAQLQAQTQVAITRLQTESQASMAAGNPALAQQQQDQINTLQQFSSILSGPNTGWYIAGAVAVVVVIGVVLYFALPSASAPAPAPAPTRVTTRVSTQKKSLPATRSQSRTNR